MLCLEPIIPLSYRIKRPIMPSWATRFIILTVLMLSVVTLHAQQPPPIIPTCTQNGIQPRPTEFQPSGLILTTFDRNAIWVYNINTDSRYPLPETVPCSRNCRPSPNREWLLRMDSTTTYAFYKMRMTGTQRTYLIAGASAVEWWNDNTFLVWTPDHRAYLLPEGTDITTTPVEYLDVRGAILVQPNGRHALTLVQREDGFLRELENLALRGLVGVAGSAPVVLGEDIPYYNDAAWSPDGRYLAYAQPIHTETSVGAYGAELFLIDPQTYTTTQATDLYTAYGAARINGHSVGDLSWSPDGTQVAFWVIPLTGSDPAANTGNATIHTYDTRSGETHAYCGFSTTEHTPNPPRLMWSPDSTHIAFGGNIPNDDKGYLLLALRASDGELFELSNGIYPALGTADVIAWGNP